MRNAKQFSHFDMYSSYVEVCNFHMRHSGNETCSETERMFCSIAVWMTKTQQNDVLENLPRFIHILIPIPMRTHSDSYLHSLCVGWRNLFSSCAVVCQCFGSGGKQVLVLLTYLEYKYNTVVALCQFFGSGGKQFLVLHMYLLYNTVVRLCQFFGCGEKEILCDLRKILIGFLYFRETTCQSKCVSHKIRTFYYCVSLSCIIQIYILTVTIISQKY